MGHGRKLTAEEERVVAVWLEHRVIVKIDKDKIQNRCNDGAIVIACGDGDQSWDFITHLVTKLRCTERVHLKTEDGGALRWNPHVPIPEELQIHHQLRRGLPISRGLKDIETVLCSGHFPCGMGKLAGLDLPATLDAVRQAASMFVGELEWPADRVIPLFHLDRGNDVKRMYFIEATSKEDIYRHI